MDALCRGMTCTSYPTQRMTLWRARKDAMAQRSDSLGARLKQLRARLGVSQMDLSKALGVGQTALSHMEDRDDIRASKVIEYVEALGGRLEISAHFSTL